MIVRSTGKSQRGLGVIRQDVNISIKGSKRVEIKGFQDLDNIPSVIDYEIERQIKLVKTGKSEGEVRAAKPDGSTDFMRPLPGRERMYPETDIPPITITDTFLKSIKTPETWEHKLKTFSKIIAPNLAKQILKSEYLDVFEKYQKDNPTLVASTLTSTLIDLRRKGCNIDNLNEKHFEKIFSGEVPKEAIPTILEEACKSPDAEIKVEIITDDVLRNIVKEVIKKNPKLALGKRIGPLMGDIMKQVRGKVDGQTIMKILKEEIDQ